jgi:hypothetical protein
VSKGQQDHGGVAMAPTVVLGRLNKANPGFPYHLYAKESVRAIAFGGMREQIMA